MTTTTLPLRAIPTVVVVVLATAFGGCPRSADPPPGEGATLAIGADPAQFGCSVDLDCDDDDVCRNGVCVPAAIDNDRDGVVASADCDDTRAAVAPGATEACNSVDDDCDGLVDEGLLNACGVCGPAAAEICDLVDNDCNGRVDDACIPARVAEAEPNDGTAACMPIPTPPAEGDVLTFTGTFGVAGDIDSFCFPTTTGLRLRISLRSNVLGAPTDGVLQLFADTGVPLPDGQNDFFNGPDPLLDYVFPGDPVRLDVSNFDPSVFGDQAFYELDIEAVSIPACIDEDLDGVQRCAGDCDDGDPDVGPGVEERCNGRDDTCDGRIDEGCDALVPDELEPNNRIADCALVSFPFAMDGVIGRPGDLDFICFFAPAGARVRFDIDAAENGSLLRSTLAVFALPALPQTQLAFNDEGIDPETGFAGDSVIAITVPRPGVYAVRVADRSAVAGGVGRRYRLIGQAIDIPVCADADDDAVSTCEGDCDDADPRTAFGFPEQCDGIDNNCDGVADLASCLVDQDGDGVSPDNGDCDDADRFAFPGAPETCDLKDNDCDGVIDDGVVNRCGGCGHPPAEQCGNAIDDDCDGIIDADCATDGDADGVTAASGDCNDDDGDVAPGAPELCDGQDNDCNGLVDEFVKNACGFCAPEVSEVCDGADNDCDGDIDDGALNACGFCGPVPLEVCDEVDNDCDGEVDEALLNRCGICGPPPPEVCDGQDNDCNGFIDEGCDVDRDEDGVTPRSGDCNDDDNAIFAGATEACDGKDNNCNGSIDDSATCPVPVESEQNGTVQTCDPLVWPRTVRGTTSASADVDFWCIDVPVGGTRLSFNVDSRDDGTALDLELAVFVDEANRIGINNDNVDPETGRPTVDPYLEVTFDSPGRYVVRVRSATAVLFGDAYTLKVDAVSGCLDLDGDGVGSCDGDCDDRNAAKNPGAFDVCDGLDNNCDGDIDERCVGSCLDDRFENNDTLFTATPTPAGAFDTLQACPGDQDFYALTAVAGAQLRCDILFEHLQINLFLELLDTDGVTVLSESKTSNNNESVSAVAPTDGVYFCRVFGPFNREGPYEAIVGITPPPAP